MTTNASNTPIPGASTATAAIAEAKPVLPCAKPHRPETLEGNPENVTVEGDAITPDVLVDAGLPELTFFPEQCLFCNLTSPDFDTNITHMHKSHGLFIPLEIEDGALALVVDLETLVQYLHLVVSGYNECLSCHTGRQTTQAVQQHMMDKGHCRIDLEGESEFRDFYEEVDEGSAASEDALDGEETCSRSDDEAVRENPRDKATKRQLSFETDGNPLHLSSGKVLSHRSAPPPRHHRPLAETQRVARRGADHKLPASSPSASRPTIQAPLESTEDDVPSPAPEAGGRALTRFERRAETNNRSTLSFALARLSANDRAALGHLPVSQQRAMVLRQFKQQDKADGRQRRYWGKMSRKNNSLLQEHYVMDSPGRKLG